ncbi:hypothetical protein, partial [Methylacidiphilum caldifontis]|uniref:hypothetical protein n=1 Tax=Methylacidiphilum caldifontis TaxID=2795386 RepID=UPI00106AAB9D
MDALLQAHPIHDEISPAPIASASIPVVTDEEPALSQLFQASPSSPQIEDAALDSGDPDSASLTAAYAMGGSDGLSIASGNAGEGHLKSASEEISEPVVSWDSAELRQLFLDVVTKGYSRRKDALADPELSTTYATPTLNTAWEYWVALGVMRAVPAVRTGRGRPPFLYDLTDLGKAVYREALGRDPGPQQWDRWRQDHDNPVHGAFITDIAEVLTKHFGL